MSVGIVCGGRNYQWREKDVVWLEDCVREYQIQTLIHGDCKAGADTILRHDEVKERLLRATEDGWLSIVAFPVLWDPTPGWIDRHRGPHRNTRMVQSVLVRYPHERWYCFSFPGATGTKDTVTKCRARGFMIILAHTRPWLTSPQEVFL